MSRLANAPWPMNYLSPAGPVAGQITALLWGLIALSVGVVVIVSLLVLVGVIRRGTSATAPLPPVARPDRGISWIYIGVGASIVPLVLFTSWTIATMAGIDQPDQAVTLGIDVTARQWWWQVRYDSDDPSGIFETANEIHIPVGVPVRFRLRSPDVIHSFWVPALGGKTDVIPGQVNDAWLQADKPGVYRGQCAEYCGLQHANMALQVIADTPDAFARWQAAQLRPANAPVDPLAIDGKRRFALACGTCHAVRGTDAGGVVGPDLTHVMSRNTLAAGTLDNTIANLSGWIADPQAAKPGTKMPTLDLAGPDLNAIRAYVGGLE